MIGGSGEREHDQNQREPGSQDPQSHHLVKLLLASLQLLPVELVLQLLRANQEVRRLINEAVHAHPRLLLHVALQLRKQPRLFSDWVTILSS